MPQPTPQYEQVVFTFEISFTKFTIYLKYLSSLWGMSCVVVRPSPPRRPPGYPLQVRPRDPLIPEGGTPTALRAFHSYPLPATQLFRYAFAYILFLLTTTSCITPTGSTFSAFGGQGVNCNNSSAVFLDKLMTTATTETPTTTIPIIKRLC